MGCIVTEISTIPLIIISVTPASQNIKTKIVSPCVCSFTNIKSIPQTIKVNLAIGCEVEDGIWEYLQVIEGNLITIDGEYIKVIRHV